MHDEERLELAGGIADLAQIMKPMYMPDLASQVYTSFACFGINPGQHIQKNCAKWPLWTATSLEPSKTAILCNCFQCVAPGNQRMRTSSYTHLNGGHASVSISRYHCPLLSLVVFLHPSRLLTTRTSCFPTGRFGRAVRSCRFIPTALESGRSSASFWASKKSQGLACHLAIYLSERFKHKDQAFRWITLMFGFQKFNIASSLTDIVRLEPSST